MCLWKRDVAEAHRRVARAGVEGDAVSRLDLVLPTCCCSSATQPVVCTDPAALWRGRCTTAVGGLNGGWLPGPVKEPVAESSEAMPDQDWS